ncbi:MAG: ABC transporter ATP-binding protein [Bacillota bacterium]
MILVLELSNVKPIFINHLKKKYGSVQALKGISFTINPGEIFGFLGPNGAGKSTTMKILVGLLAPTAGESKILGEPSQNLSLATKRKIGVVFEENNLYKKLTGLENLKFYASIYQIDYSRVQELLDFFTLSEAADRRVETFSKGMKQRLLIARALLADPEILILDEPTSGLDPQSIEIIHQAIYKFKDEGKTIFLSSHFMEEVDRLCDRIAFINQGKIITISSPDILKSYYGQKSLRIKIKDSGVNLSTLRNVLPEQVRISTEKSNKNIEIPLHTENLGGYINTIKKNYDIISIHTREASLHNVFIQLAQEKENINIH